MVFYTERERFIHFYSTIFLVFGVVLAIPFGIIAFTAVPVFGAAPTAAKIVVGSFFLVGLVLLFFSIRRLLTVKDYIEIDPDRKQISLYEKKKHVKTVNYTDDDYLYVDAENRSSVDPGDATRRIYHHIRLSSLDMASIYESQGELSARRKAKELAEAMGVGLQAEGGDILSAEDASTTLRERLSDDGSDEASERSAAPRSAARSGFEDTGVGGYDDVRDTGDTVETSYETVEDDGNFTIVGARKRKAGLIFGIIVLIGSIAGLWWLLFTNDFITRIQNNPDQNTDGIIICLVAAVVGLGAFVLGIRSSKKKDKIIITDSYIQMNESRKIKLDEIEEIKKSARSEYPQIMAANDYITISSSFCPRSEAERLENELRRLITRQLQKQAP